MENIDTTCIGKYGDNGGGDIIIEPLNLRRGGDLLGTGQLICNV